MSAVRRPASALLVVLALAALPACGGSSSASGATRTVLTDFNSDQFADLRGASYGFFRQPAVRLAARLALRTPLRLIACNDIYAIATRA